jgi:hypothetical protein|tara:strand:+ start:3944 stop:4597 length:654 start_codon:yes stop_codon:yes gene_type:complete
LQEKLEKALDEATLKKRSLKQQPPEPATCIASGDKRKRVIEMTCAKAAADGNLTALKWLRKNGCPWDEKTCANAAEGGHVGVLKWAHENGCPWGSWTCTWEADPGHLEVHAYYLEKLKQKARGGEVQPVGIRSTDQGGIGSPGPKSKPPSGTGKQPDTGNSSSEPVSNPGAGPYMLFCNDIRPKIAAHNPEFTSGQIDKALAATWRGVAERSKAKYR